MTVDQGLQGLPPDLRVAPSLGCASRASGCAGPGPATIDVGNAGTLLRLLPGWLAGQEGGRWTLDGDDSIRRRPVDRIAVPLRQMGAWLSCREDRLPPLQIEGAPLHGITYEMPIASAQVKSCLLFAGLLAEGETRVVEPLPSRDHTERMLAAAGASIERDGDAVVLRPAERLEPELDPRPRRHLLRRLLPRRGRAGRGQRGGAGRDRHQPDPHRPADDPRADGGGDRTGRGADGAASRSPACGSARRHSRPPRSAAPRSRWRSTSCRWSPSPPASPRGRRSSATPRSCAARSPTGSRP